MLINRAIAQLEKAYAPYSHFLVGSALVLNNGEIFFGANQENASYPLCMCSERICLYNAAMSYPNVPVDTIAIVARNEKKKLEQIISPCGACRQVICEYEMRYKQGIRLLLHVADQGVLEVQSSDLLPHSFTSSAL